MSDELRDAMSRAVDRFAPLPPSAEALKAAAKRSRYRRHIIGGWIGFIILGTLSGWLFFKDNEAENGTARPDGRRVAAPLISPTTAQSVDPLDGKCCNRTYRNEQLGYSVAYPDDWNRATEPMTKLANPREVLTLSTVPLDINEGQLGDCAPLEPLSRLGPTDLLIHVQERQWVGPEPDSKDYPQRPAELGMDDLAGPEALECWGEEIFWTTFSDSDRAILLYVALGKDITPEWQGEVSQVLDSIRFDPLTKEAPAESGEPSPSETDET